MNWLEGFIYGLVSGITEFLPVSSQAHQRIIAQLFGADGCDPVRNLVVHIATVICLYMTTRRLLQRLRRENHASHRSKHRSHNADIRANFDLRLVRGAVIPMLLMMLLLIVTRSWANDTLIIAGFSVINGIIIYISERCPHANKDSRHMSILDAIVFGLFGAFSVFPGISRIGASQAYATMRGVDRQQSTNWAFLLSIPALLMLCIFDIADIIGGVGRAVSFAVIAGYIMAAIGAFIGTYLCTVLIRKASSRINTAVFAYYSWGVALFALVLYLIS